MPVGAILFDKDGTLVDIQLTLGPATCDVLWRLSGGEQAMPHPGFWSGLAIVFWAR